MIDGMNWRRVEQYLERDDRAVVPKARPSSTLT